MVEGRGVGPDSDVDDNPVGDEPGQDTQLERAIEVVMQQMRERPMALPPRPPAPIKTPQP